MADLCGQAGNAKLAITILDDTEKIISDSKSRPSSEASRRLLASVQRRRIKWLAVIFELLLNEQKAEELWHLAKSQAGFALERHDIRLIAQCFSWMSIAAITAGNYDLGKEHAEDAIVFAQQSRYRFREGFSHFYLGNAHRASGQTREAAMAYATAIKVLPKRKLGRIHAAVMLSMAQVTEQLGELEPALQLYMSARQLAEGMGQTDLWEVSEGGVTRLSETTGKSPREP